MNVTRSTQTLIEAFSALASEVQNLTDRKTILEHKLRFAHEQFQYLADKYAPAAPEISETISKLQLPATYIDHPSVKDASVPLPRRNGSALNASHQIALLIRDGRRAASQLAVSLPTSSPTDSHTHAYAHAPAHKSVSATAHAHTHPASLSSIKETTAHLQPTVTSMSTVLEQDFTVVGKKGQLECPFSAPRSVRQPPAMTSNTMELPSHSDKQEKEPGHSEVIKQDNGHEKHGHQDPICASMVAEESKSHEDPSATCPIRYLDKHTPEEIAQYVEKHKHQIPRSHEICVRRYQQSDEQVRKLDAKYGSLVSMIEGLSQLHKPMLASEEAALEELRTQEKRLHEGVGENDDGDSIGHGYAVVGGRDVKSKTQRVEQWAQAVGQSIGTNADTDPNAITVDDEDGDRGRVSSLSDQPILKDVRVGESPSRPWGIPVPVPEGPPAEYGDIASNQSSLPAPANPAVTTCHVGDAGLKYADANAITRKRDKPKAGVYSDLRAQAETSSKGGMRKCPFDHAKLAAMGISRPPMTAAVAAEAKLPPPTPQPEMRPSCQAQYAPPPPPLLETPEVTTSPTLPTSQAKYDSKAPASDTSHQPEQQPQQAPNFSQLPANANIFMPPIGTKESPQMVFNGPVFIGYSVEDAVQLIRQFQMGAQQP
ncbi:hypothetical protein Cpir12675_005687 [Ceratocystis pirilliformis]|uniref:Uncharacterized protein n=1 Tax=Ceratocystis pirilliformis TaxID=259994 RepID=A0ABR3YN97_9PEZI